MSNAYTIIHSNIIGTQKVRGLISNTTISAADISNVNSLLSDCILYNRFNAGTDTIGFSDGLIVSFPWNADYGQQWALEDTSHTIRVRYKNKDTSTTNKWGGWRTIAFTDSHVASASKADAISAADGSDSNYLTTSTSLVKLNVNTAITGSLSITESTGSLALDITTKKPSGTSTIVPAASAITLGANGAGHSGYHAGIGFSALRYSPYTNHIHAWIGLGPYTTTATAECYPLVIAVNSSTVTNTAPTEVIRILPTGEVGIGTTSPSNKLEVNGNIKATGSIIVGNNTVATQTWVNSQGFIKATTENDVKFVRVGQGISNDMSTWSLRLGTDPYTLSNGKTNDYEYNVYSDYADGATNLGTEAHRWYYVYGYAFSQGSDATKKNIIGNVELSINQIANAPAVDFTWKMNGRKDVGTIAQYWKDVLPEVVNGSEGSYGVNYATLAVVSSIIIARSVETHEQRIARLEQKLKKLQKELEELIGSK